MPNFLLYDSVACTYLPVKAPDAHEAYETAALIHPDWTNALTDPNVSILADAWVSTAPTALEAKAELWTAMGPDASELDRDRLWEVAYRAEGYFIPNFIQAIESL